MDRPRGHHTKRRKQEGQMQISYDITYMWNLKKKNMQMNLFTKEKCTHKQRKQANSNQRG